MPGFQVLRTGNAFSASGFALGVDNVYRIRAVPPLGSSPGHLSWFFAHSDQFTLFGPPLQNLTFDSLPPGILFTPGSIAWAAGANIFPFAPPDPSCTLTDPAGNVQVNGFGLSGLTFTILQFFGFYTLDAVINNGSEIDMSVAGLTFGGQYTTMTISISAPNPTHNGDIVTLTGPSGLDGVASIQLINGSNLTTVLAADFISQSATQLVFRIPLFYNNPGTVNLIGIGNGVQFSGSVTLGTLTVLIENGSGVYEIVPGKTNDTIYTNSGTDATTTDVAIPNPFAETGFVGG